MSRQARDSARARIDGVIETVVEQETTEEEQDLMRDALTGVADVVFGIWTSLDRIAAAINGKNVDD